MNFCLVVKCFMEKMEGGRVMVWTLIWHSSRGKAISLLIGAYIIMTVMVGSCTVILKCCQNTLWRELFQNPLKRQLDANIGRGGCGNCHCVKNNVSCYKDANAKVQPQDVQVLYILKLVMSFAFAT